MLSLLIDKKSRYLIISILISITLGGFWFSDGAEKFLFGVAAVVITALGAFLAMLPNVKLNSVFYVSILPVHLTIGAITAFLGFPNLSDIFVIASLIIFGVITYTTYLINNVFLVVEEKNEIIPLYRVAVTWSQIMIIVIAIPFFSGVFKIPLIFYIQNLVIGVSSLLFTLYLIWSLHFDPDIKKMKVGEKFVYAAFVAFIVFCVSMAVSLFPTESFLKALFCSSVLLSILGYIYNNLINRVTRSLMWEYLIISFIFLLVLVVFTP